MYVDLSDVRRRANIDKIPKRPTTTTIVTFVISADP